MSNVSSVWGTMIVNNYQFLSPRESLYSRLVLTRQQTKDETSKMTTQHDALLQRIRDGDQAALEILLAEVQPQLYRFSLKMCRHPEDAEDVLQESMLALARSLRNLKAPQNSRPISMRSREISA